MQIQELLKSLGAQGSLRFPDFEEIRKYVHSLSTSSLIGLGAFATLTAYWLATRPRPIQAPCDLEHQSVPVQGDPSCRRSALLKDETLLDFYYKDTKTAYEMFQRGLRISGEGPCLGFRKPKGPYEWISYKEVSDQAEFLGSGLLHRGCLPSPDQFIGVFAQNRPEWVVAELACYTYSMAVVPLYDTLGEEAMVHILNIAEISMVICDKPEKAGTLLTNVEQSLTPGLKTVILMNSCDAALLERGRNCGVEILQFRDIMVSMFCHGARVGFYQGDIQLLMDDIKTLKPTFFPVVPRLLNRIYDKILGSVASPLRRAVLQYAVRWKQAELSSGIVRNNSFWDLLLFNRIQASLGGNLRFILTASAPISPSVLIFLRAVLGCLIFEGYGQTECTAGCTFSMPGDWTAGHVGAPLPCALVKVVDIEEMNYLASNGEGEICIKGPSVFQGYLKDAEKTSEALDSQGWLHTGDVGKWLPNGALKIIDRKKHMFKLSQGEYIAPEKIENVYLRSAALLQVFVHGDSLQSHLIGIVVPDPEVFTGWAQEKGIVGSYDELCRNQEVKAAILEDLTRLGKEAGLKSFEQVKDLYIHPEIFSICNGLLTPTMKARRADIRKRFQGQISRLYSKSAF
ncbi:UNVERIFIED_CONTAM: hypothetical protein FKN15_024787 [Acipenser sinensis]